LRAAQSAHDPVETLKRLVGEESLAELDYAEATSDRLLLAVRIGRTRLIDNAPYTEEPAR
jgi:pantothenate synthetase